MKSSYPSAAIAAHCVRVRPTMVRRTLWSGINAAIAAALFAAFTTHWAIAAARSAAFAFFYVPCVIAATWDAASAAVFCDMIMYWIIVKHGSYCCHLVTSICLVFIWVQWNRYLKPCHLHWVISPCFSITTKFRAPTCVLWVFYGSRGYTYISPCSNARISRLQDIYCLRTLGFVYSLSIYSIQYKFS